MQGMIEGLGRVSNQQMSLVVFLHLSFSSSFLKDHTLSLARQAIDLSYCLILSIATLLTTQRLNYYRRLHCEIAGSGSFASTSTTKFCQSASQPYISHFFTLEICCCSDDTSKVQPFLSYKLISYCAIHKINKRYRNRQQQEERSSGPHGGYSSRSPRSRFDSWKGCLEGDLNLHIQRL